MILTAKECKGQKGPKGRRHRALVVETEMFSDPITRAIARNREQRQAGTPERDSVWNHVFRCVCCGKTLDERERREPRSEVCMRCVRGAGFYN